MQDVSKRQRHPESPDAVRKSKMMMSEVVMMTIMAGHDNDGTTEVNGRGVGRLDEMRWWLALI